MTAVRSGQFAGCPIVCLPTGYMVWCVENDKLKKQWQEFQAELKHREKLLNTGDLQIEPEWHETIRNEQWFIDLDDSSQVRYKSMITAGAWNWQPKQKKHKDAMTRLGQVLNLLEQMYPTTDSDDSGYDELFDAPSEVRLATPEEIKAGWDKERSKQQKDKLVALLKKQDEDYPVPTREDVMPKLTADDIIDRIRSKNSRTQQAMVYGSLLNQLTSVADLISEQEQHFDIWEMRDLEWHLNSVKNRIQWLLQQREDI